mmetsp:Transcript_15901/g.38204  ORF Transcript_15901/g.38204 Transcript_15901/m.38204 type:complete len:311 (-) Transcript_15901:42-974(-)
MEDAVRDDGRLVDIPAPALLQIILPQPQYALVKRLVKERRQIAQLLRDAFEPLDRDVSNILLSRVVHVRPRRCPQVPREDGGHVGVLRRERPPLLIHHRAMLARRDAEFLEQLPRLDGDARLPIVGRPCRAKARVGGDGIPIEFVIVAVVLIVLVVIAPSLAVGHVNSVPRLIVREGAVQSPLGRRGRRILGIVQRQRSFRGGVVRDCAVVRGIVAGRGPLPLRAKERGNFRPRLLVVGRRFGAEGRSTVVIACDRFGRRGRRCGVLGWAGDAVVVADVGHLLLLINDAHHVFVYGVAAQPGGQELVHLY